MVKLFDQTQFQVLQSLLGEENLAGELNDENVIIPISKISEFIKNVKVEEVDMNGEDGSTTSKLFYGINLITTSTALNFSARLPEEYIVGQNLKVLNISNYKVRIYPSASGGSINGVVDGFIEIPPDKKVYTINCIDWANGGSWNENYYGESGGSSGLNSVTGFGVDNTDPLNPIVNKYTSGNLTPLGTTALDAAPIVDHFTRLTNGNQMSGALLPDSASVGNRYVVINSTSTNKVIYSNVNSITFNGLFSNSLVIPPKSTYSFVLGNIGWTTNEEGVGYGKYKSYTALLTQSGTNAPTAIVLQNEFYEVGFTWGYDNVGSFFVQASSPVFTANKTFVIFTPNYSHPKIFTAERVNNNVVIIGTFSDPSTPSSVFLNASFEIRVYN